ncbi:hypothetical protein LZP69_10665 [Shewanella sp. AS1]|uniref:DUF6950 family protein n=1 Tax=Shewanella sp. AS1 TaxID=2907626 RepID=UPI001F261784|nr:hypothetical protein [Shewanella sp. AS1]MCE9679622.1 hypothetical protein [Shewanella sp. AS1]
MNLADFVNQQRHRPFVWGEHDCCLMAADWLKANGRGDLAAEFRGKYTTAFGAIRAYRREGYFSIADLLAAKLGEPTSTLLLRRGAVVLLDTPTGDVVGLYQGSDCFALGPDGLVSYPKTQIKQGWNVLWVR